MKKKKKFLRYTKERAILSDVLPYEAPLIFSNRYFYRFLVSNKIEIKDKRIYFKNTYSPREEMAFFEIMRLIFNINPKTQGKNHGEINEKKRIPFNYKIAHKENDFRTLTVINPTNQLILVQFYERYKEQIIYYSRISSFSIRRPDSVAKFIFFKDKLHDKYLDKQNDFIEIKGKEYENLRSFFSYKKYTNIHRFYEDYRYQRAEKKFKFLYKFDITKCFDSIYSHSIAWALMNKEIVKDEISLSKLTFGGQFDRFIQDTNYGETNGIIIGPEFSRIFAELILQKVDKTVEVKLKEECLFYRRDYEIYRYVDDYFLFCNNEADKECIIKSFRHELKEFKMSLNDLKAMYYIKPMITEITIAKQKINKLFEEEPRFKIISKENPLLEVEFEEDEEVSIFNDHAFIFYINPNKLAVKFKTIVKESKIEYKDVLNYTLSILNTKIDKILKKFESKFYEHCRLEHRNEISDSDLNKKKKLENNFAKFILGYVDFVFFLYSVSPRVNSSIKLSNILSKIINYYKGIYKIKLADDSIKIVSRMKEMNQDLIFKKISDDVSLILDRNQMDKHTQIEVLYLIIIIKELGKNYRLNQNQLAKYFNCLDESGKISMHKNVNLNYFSITSLIFYIRNIPTYQEFKEELMKYILAYVEKIDIDKRNRDTEATLMILDLLVCPFLDQNFKEKLLELYQVPIHIRKPVIDFRSHQKYWFIKWDNFDFSKELNSKNSEEVYS